MNLIRKTEKMRYKFVGFSIKFLTPSLYKKLLLMSCLESQPFKFIIDGLSDIPRPSIKFMKDYFNGKLVKGVEIGVEKGINAESILKELNIDKLYLVDPYINYDGIEYKSPQKNAYKTVLDKFSNNNKVEMIRAFSERAIPYLKDESLDFVYIDGNHTYNYVLKDIELCFKKVKVGGLIAGHDIFNSIEVLNAVKDFCCEKHLYFTIDLPDWYFVKEIKRD